MNYVPLSNSLDFEVHIISSAVISIAALVISYFSIPAAAPSFEAAGLFGIDIGKPKPTDGNPPHVPEGLGLVCGIVYLASLMLTDVIHSDSFLTDKINVLYMLSSSLLILGFADDVLNIRWRTKIMLSIVSSLPVVRHFWGDTTVSVPHLSIWHYFFGDKLTVNLGIIYIMFLVCVMIFCINSINIYAGINGLEVGQSIVIGISVIIFGTIGLNKGGITTVLPSENEQQGGVIISRSKDLCYFAIVTALPFVAVCLALWVHNKYPSKVFVGDTFTHWAGATLAAIGILGKFPFGLLLFFIPQIVNFVLSFPQLIHFLIPASIKSHLPLPFQNCPRHRIPRLDRTTGKLKYTPNLTLINTVLYFLGPMKEKTLTNVLILLQTICCSIVLLCYGMDWISI
ncbi:putative UDP-N-acetylglucosamine--dolichyl-phosphate N-acetylglucosaminephosphotransferase [Monocercomonoides exilis]|uniref:putative UDP-N-acetylglucosamine--dolichyl-phosphate N-acetylglucosaminephosphotransferase n=1 Tax=Monocercomonoides exilis TaxID=2049356 RepID=UPI00355A4EFD|nr:putative UDP-N-acetylglucosamine--dolichyl-phosphate N-acetylglucosaminephosphotransferase [Monocercomonoides exilis]|eukprot:MONOS_5776.1-p1 / transcript=MONOS_5776.1 / gene=MONOS_5776 / organism=Monocercomonoides_exilis_PA203 / gene_product=UDP-N-acetylglucosamine--dolichyl-phosphate N-acetylglucosaminephosphotransferase / transcript_product=UDP-N-acetylglucosamine--dolichyl-phosphate N-acetylglucosaminephosphotransferase / location=Mono_scaffold00173:12963-14602(-) / protein_length=398 / sequence_SO=supercontig / SO=protein_coding / is_pseudo=false